uniref:NADH dehydrogenase subunit 6 n=1 Tax=Scydmaeninae sp. BMNH 1274313 TaxID=1796549 RepID=A0A126TFB8_9COLE|nr:NADH dehydrogenase subunit 6 [Scydmaeninae sp. BMNH 1274313]
MMKILLMNSMLFIILSHPLSISLMLIYYTIMSLIYIGYMLSNFWFSYIIFLIMIGGLMILFMYMTSIASNEKFNFSYYYSMSFIFISNILFMNYYYKIKPLFKMNNYLSLNLTKLFMFPYNFIMIFMISYLFITLLATIKIINIKSGPLRQIN